MYKVFLIEDEIVIREALERMIPWNEYGFELVGKAKDGEIALPMIRKTKPDVLITDIKMPFMDGLTLSGIVKKEIPEIRIVIVSGYDDFEYARKAIALGVDDYLLKPIAKADFVRVLQKIQKDFEEKGKQQDYYEKFEQEIKKYENHSRRDFFELLVTKHADLPEIYDRAEKLSIDIMAESYNLVFFSLAESRDTDTIDQEYSQRAADVQKQIDDTLQKEKNLYMFRNQTFSYVLLLTGDAENIQTHTEHCVKLLQDILEKDQSGLEWIVCASKPVERLSQMPDCYKEGMQLFAYRYFGYSHVISQDMVPVGESQSRDNEIKDLVSVDSNVVNPAIVQNFLCNGLENEVAGFVENYLQMVGESALKSKMFRQYILLNIHFCIVSFLQKLGYEKDVVDHSLLEASGMGKPLDHDKIAASISGALKQAIQLREEKSKGKYQNVLQNAVQYMEENFADENLTLNTVACVANVSANHFSAMFSQKMGQTFIEYLTSLRMNRAKELLRCTDKRSGEIALEVGYKDSHYFSFLFKKTQGCTPSEYRNQGAVS